jgi:hypothetical protein
MWLRLAGGTLVVIGATMACGIAAVAAGGKHAVGALVGPLLISAVGPAAGVSLWRLARRRELGDAAGRDRADGARLLELARTRGGHLTAAEVLARTGIELPRAERLLDGLCRQGLRRPVNARW